MKFFIPPVPPPFVHPQKLGKDNVLKQFYSKILKMKKLTFLSFYLVSTLFCSAQTTVEKTIVLKDSSFQKSITLNIKEGISVINFLFKSNLTGGEVAIKILDPEDKMEGRFGLDAIVDGIKQPSSGRMTHSISTPVAGIWKVQIQVQNAIGNLYYKIYFN